MTAPVPTDADTAAELAAARADERARIAATLAGPLAAYDAASSDWSDANDEQNDAPSVKDAERYSDALENAAHGWAAVVRDLADGAATKAPADDTWGWQGVPDLSTDELPAHLHDRAHAAPEGLAVFAHWSAVHRGVNVEIDLPDGLPITVHVNDGLVFQWQPGDDPAAGILTDPQRTIYVVNWTPEGVGGFEWRRTREEAAAVLVALADPTARVHVVELPEEVDAAHGSAIDEWLDAEGWSDGGDPRV